MIKFFAFSAFMISIVFSFSLTIADLVLVKGNDIMGIFIGSSPVRGKFALQIDDVYLK